MDETNLGWEDLFIKGANYNVTPDMHDLSKPTIFRGVVKRKYIQWSIDNKRDFFYMDTGYFGNFKSPANPNGKKIWHRIVRNNLQNISIGDYPSDRWQSLVNGDPRLKWTGWKTKGNKILIIVPNRKSCVFYGHDLEPYSETNGKRPWLETTISTIKKYTDMEIVIREKGSRSDRQNHTIYDALDQGIFATVAFNSIAALESVIYGIPAFVAVPCAASPLASDNLEKIATPYYPDYTLIEKHCKGLAYSQFTAEEIQNGTAWRLLNR